MIMMGNIERYLVETDIGLELSIKDSNTDKYPFSLACENLDEFESLVSEVMNVKDLLNEKESEINRLRYVINVLTDENMRLKANDEEITYDPIPDAIYELDKGCPL